MINPRSKQQSFKTSKKFAFREGTRKLQDILARCPWPRQTTRSPRKGIKMRLLGSCYRIPARKYVQDARDESAGCRLSIADCMACNMCAELWFANATSARWKTMKRDWLSRNVFSYRRTTDINVVSFYSFYQHAFLSTRTRVSFCTRVVHRRYIFALFIFRLRVSKNQVVRKTA